jgi:hypothetical protein
MSFADFIEEIGLVAWNAAVKIAQPHKSIISCGEKEIQLDASALKDLHEPDRLRFSEVGTSGSQCNATASNRKAKQTKPEQSNRNRNTK